MQPLEFVLDSRLSLLSLIMKYYSLNGPGHSLGGQFAETFRVRLLMPSPSQSKEGGRGRKEGWDFGKIDLVYVQGEGFHFSKSKIL